MARNLPRTTSAPGAWTLPHLARQYAPSFIAGISNIGLDDRSFGTHSPGEPRLRSSIAGQLILEPSCCYSATQRSRRLLTVSACKWTTRCMLSDVPQTTDQNSASHSMCFVMLVPLTVRSRSHRPTLDELPRRSHRPLAPRVLRDCGLLPSIYRARRRRPQFRDICLTDRGCGLRISTRIFPAKDRSGRRERVAVFRGGETRHKTLSTALN